MAASSTHCPSFLRRSRAASALPRVTHALLTLCDLPDAAIHPVHSTRRHRTSSIGCGGRLNARSARIPPIFRLFGGRVSVADRRGLIREYATPVWKFGRRLGAALGRLRSIKRRASDRLNQHSTPFLLPSNLPLPPLLLHRYPSRLNLWCRWYYALLSGPCSSGNDGLDFRRRATLTSLALGHHAGCSRPSPPSHHCLFRRCA
ncbi:hypothetical protein GGG16DRAFT_120456 [Schizophyllum commune]